MHVASKVFSTEKVVLGWFAYNTIPDQACTRIFPEWLDLADNWRDDIFRVCSCGVPPVPVLLYTSYGGGFYWPSEACLACAAIVGRTDSFDAGEVQGRPDWFPEEN